MPEMFSHREIIYTIYKEQSFSRAAQKLFIAQPSLSLLVKKLENQLGVPLFDRSCKPIRLTEAGKEYIRAVESIRETEETLRAFSALEKEQVRLENQANRARKDLTDLQDRIWDEYELTYGAAKAIWEKKDPEEQKELGSQTAMKKKVSQYVSKA